MAASEDVRRDYERSAETWELQEQLKVAERHAADRVLSLSRERTLWVVNGVVLLALTIALGLILAARHEGRTIPIAIVALGATGSLLCALIARNGHHLIVAYTELDQAYLRLLACDPKALAQTTAGRSLELFAIESADVIYDDIKKRHGNAYRIVSSGGPFLIRRLVSGIDALIQHVPAEQRSVGIPQLEREVVRLRQEIIGLGTGSDESIRTSVTAALNDAFLGAPPVEFEGWQQVRVVEAVGGAGEPGPTQDADAAAIEVTVGGGEPEPQAGAERIVMHGEASDEVPFTVSVRCSDGSVTPDSATVTWRRDGPDVRATFVIEAADRRPVEAFVTTYYGTRLVQTTVVEV